MCASGVLGLPAVGRPSTLRTELIQALVEGMAQDVTLQGRQGYGSMDVGLHFKLACNPSDAEIPQPQFFDPQIRIPQRLFESKPLLILVFAQGQRATPDQMPAIRVDKSISPTVDALKVPASRA